ncbi:myeloid cell surface antigen CD33-like [Monodelphis domestica]|uniref:myeloid cell surface antigen CD33-like n=1 Tax=Monodelphis domestica TaxID=13616 RepID=UPI0024E1F856|nr:myeloid cell surface antigen CD33-like [Monodelphis domestica]
MDLLLLLLLLLLQFLDGSFSQEQPVFGLHVQKKVTVQKGLCVSIPCSFYYPPESRNNDTAHGYWYWKESQDDPGATKEDLVATNDPQKATQPWAQGRFYLIGDPQMDNCSLSITGAQKRDRGHYEFRVEKGKLRYSYTNDRVLIQPPGVRGQSKKERGKPGKGPTSGKIDSLRLDTLEELFSHLPHSFSPSLSLSPPPALTQKPEIHMPEILEPGHQVALTCLVPGDCRNGTSASFLWTGNALSSQQLTSSKRSSSRLLFTPQRQDNGTNLTCQVRFPEGRVNTERTVQLRIAGEFGKRVEPR